MRHLIYIIMTLLCSFSFGQGIEAFSQRAESVEKGEHNRLESRYAVQLECAHRCNNYAERSQSISVPTTNISSAGARANHHRVDSIIAPMPTVAAGAIFSIRFSLYRICSKRVIDYYLYTLCCLRL
ncbi:MAG: hypothetical protein IJX65_07350 [Alistipes sp.]|nr:hypothetical protein [Alistipes sp.]